MAAYNGFGDWWQDVVINHLFGKVPYTPLEHIYVGVSTTDPGEDGTAVAEPTDASYARVETAPGDWTESTGGAGLTENINAVQFAPASASWGTIAYWPMFDQALGAALAITAVVASTHTFTVAGEHAAEFPVGSLFCIRDSTANDGNWTVVSATDDTNTSIVVVETITDETVDGDIYSMGHFVTSAPVDEAKIVSTGDAPVIAPGEASVAVQKSSA